MARVEGMGGTALVCLGTSKKEECAMQCLQSCLARRAVSVVSG